MDSNDNGTVPAFLKKLWILVEDESCDDLISWGENGTSFHVYDQAKFSRNVLPQYFKHSNISSFIRQLNMYGFRKVMNVEQGSMKVERDDLEFHHPYFQQGHEELLEYIKRKVSSSPGVKVDAVNVKQEDVSKVLSDVCYLKGKQDTFNNRMDILKRENEALWREIANLRQKHMKQQQIVNKLIQFLVTLVRGNNRGIPTNPMKRVMPLMLNDSSQIMPKKPKMTRQLSIEKTSQAYSVQSPPSGELSYTSSTMPSGPIIHEVTDVLAGSPSTVNIEEITPDDLLREVDVNAENLSNFSNTTQMSTPAADLNVAVTTSPVRTTSSVISANSGHQSDRKDVTDQLDLLQTDIDELKDLLAGGQYSLDPTLLMGLFNPESPISQVGDPVANSDDKVIKQETSGMILGNELIQYEPQDDLSTLPLFDLGDVELNIADFDNGSLDSDLAAMQEIQVLPNSSSSNSKPMQLKPVI